MDDPHSIDLALTNDLTEIDEATTPALEAVMDGMLVASVDEAVSRRHR